MQRWIVVALIGAILFGVGGAYGLWTIRENRPKKIWTQLPLNPEVPEEKRKALADEIKAKILEGSIVSTAAKETGLARRLKFTSDSEAEADARKRLFVVVSEVKTREGTVPCINIGFDCQRKSVQAYGDVSMRIMKDVWKMLGLEEPKGDTI